MGDPREEAVEQLEKHQETLRLDDFVRIVELHHRDEGPGVARDLLADYAEAAYFDVDLEALDDRVTDSDAWEEGEKLYDLGDGRISTYPPDWHEALGDTSDLKHVIEVIQNEVTEPEGDQLEAVTEERGVPEEKILRVAEVVAGIDRGSTREELKRLRKNDEIEEFASQHRDPTIRLS